jgi:hypothetical protein
MSLQTLFLLSWHTEFFISVVTMAWQGGDGSLQLKVASLVS